ASTSSTRAHSSETAVKTRSGLASDATRVATLRSARCSCARRPTSWSFASASKSNAPSSEAPLGGGALRSIPAVTRIDDAPSSPGISLFDQATSFRPPSFVSQCPTWAREAGLPDVGEHLAEGLGFLGRDDELAGVASDRLGAGKAGQPFAG